MKIKVFVFDKKQISDRILLGMKFLEKLSNILPETILLIITGLIFIFVYRIGIQFSQIIALIQVLAWPGVAIIGILLFKKVFTYMFFSMDQFSFFGMRGNLKNVNDLINEEVEKKFQEEKRKKDAELEFDDLKNRLGKAEGDIKETTKLAREILEEWKKDSKESSELFAKVLLENKKLKEQLSNSPVVPISHEDKKEALGSGDKIEKNEKPDGSNEL